MIHIRKAKLLSYFAYGVLLIGKQELLCPFDPQTLPEIHGTFTTILPEQPSEIAIADTAFRSDLRQVQVAVLFQ